METPPKRMRKGAEKLRVWPYLGGGVAPWVAISDQLAFLFSYLKRKSLEGASSPAGELESDE